MQRKKEDRIAVSLPGARLRFIRQVTGMGYMQAIHAALDAMFGHLEGYPNERHLEEEDWDKIYEEVHKPNLVDGKLPNGAYLEIVEPEIYRRHKRRLSYAAYHKQMKKRRGT